MESPFGLVGQDQDFLQRRCTLVNGPVIVGAGPSGLATAACLREQGVPFIVLERSDCIASLWQKRTYDRLKLHLPKQFCQLPKPPFPEDFPEYPTKKQFIDYLESYARHFEIDPRFNECVQFARYDETNGFWRVKTVSNSDSIKTEVEYICRWLVVATGEKAECVMPEINGLNEFGGEVLHACNYKSGEKFRGKKVLVVGCGNSSMELSLDLFNHDAQPSMVVRSSVNVLPREILRNIEKFGLKWPSMDPLELKNTKGKIPVLDIGALEKIRSSDINVVPGIKRFYPGQVELVNGEILDIDAVVLATGYRSDVPYWLQVRKSNFTKTEVECIYRWLVVATGENAECVMPEINGLNEFAGEVLHACNYKSSKKFRGKKVLVVGCGNSGMELSLDLCNHNAQPSMVVRSSVHVLPREILVKSTFELAVLMKKWLLLWLVDKYKQKGHIAPNCPTQPSQRSDWWKNQPRPESFPKPMATAAVTSDDDSVTPWIGIIDDKQSTKQTTTKPIPNKVLSTDIAQETVETEITPTASSSPYPTQLSAAPKGRIAGKKAEDVSSSGVDELEKRLAALRHP